MERITFYQKFSYLLNRNEIEGEVISDSFKYGKYIIFGQNSIGFPVIYLEKDTSIGAVDVFSVELVKCYRDEIEQKQLVLFHTILQFLRTLYQEVDESFILFKQTNSSGIVFTSSVDNKWINSSFDVVNEQHPAYSFINKEIVEWCIHPKNEYIQQEFHHLLQIKDHLLTIQHTFPKRKLFIHNLQLIKGDHFCPHIVFESNGITYYITPSEEGASLYHLKVLGKKHYFSVPFSIQHIDIPALIDEIETINQFYRLFEE